jgi:hypothetical protein
VSSVLTTSLRTTVTEFGINHKKCGEIP